MTRPPRARAAAMAAQAAVAHFDEFRVHDVRAHRVGAHGLKRAGAHVQRDERGLHAALAERREQRLVEVQAGGGCGDRAMFAREHALVASAVGGIGFAPDVRRQRHLAVALEKRERGFR